MLNLARFSVNRPVAAGIVSFALFVLGVFAVWRLPVSLYPNVSFPFVNVTLVYPGASAEQIEATVVKPLEKELAGLSKLSRLISIVRPNGARVIVGFKMSADERQAVDGVREKVALVKGSFPAGVKEPIVSRVDMGATPVLIFGVKSQLPPSELKKTLDLGIVRELQRANGVSEASVVGLGEELLEVQLNAAKLSSLRIAPLEIFGQLQQKVGVVPWGDWLDDGKQLNVSRNVPPADPLYWENQVVSTGDSRPIRLGEVGTVSLLRDPDAPSVLINGQPGLGLVVSKRADANTIDTVDNVTKVLDNSKNLAGIELFQIVNQASYVKENAHEVWIALFAGGAFAIAVIFLFLTDFKSALISATALPVSVAGTFIFMQLLGFSLNTMSLLALALAIGLLIDDAVVVRESIYAQLELAEKNHSLRTLPKKLLKPFLLESAIKGTDKVASAVLATSLAVVAVFLPVGLMDGLVGQFFKEFGLTICIAVLLSTWVAFTLDPLLSAHFAGLPSPLQGRFWDSWRAFLIRLEKLVAHIGKWSFGHPISVIFLACVSLIASILLALSRGSDFLAFEDRGQFVVDLRAAPGASKSATEALAAEVTKRLSGLEGLQNVYANVGLPNEPRRIELRFVFVPKTQRKKGLLELQAQARKQLEGLNASWLVMDPPPIEGIGGEAPISLYVYGEDLVALQPVAEKLRQRIAKLPGIAGIRAENEILVPAFNVTLNPQDIAFAQAQQQSVEISGRLALNGLEIGRVGSDNTLLNMRFQSTDRTPAQLWENLLVPSLRGPQFLNQLASFSKVERIQAIDREKRMRKITLAGTMDRSRTFGEVLQAVEKEAAKVEAPFFAEVGGDKEVFTEMIESFTLAIAGSFFFIFVILAAQFENLFRPFVILLSLPLAVIGGFFALFLFGQEVALGALIGLILLIGLAAKNGILLVDAIGEKSKKMSLADAVYLAVLERTRPILMTSIAMLFGMIPTAIMRGDGSEFRSPMAIAIIGGVVSSTLLSFLVVPAVFGIIAKVRGKGGGQNSSGTPLVNSATTALICLFAVICRSWLSSEPALAAEFVSPQQKTLSDPMAATKNLLRAASLDQAAISALASAEAAADGGYWSSRMALLGGLRAEAGREWYAPGVTQSFSFPLFTPQGVSQIESKTIVVPKAQNVVSLGWQIPLFNLQALYGLQMADILSANVPLVEKAKREGNMLQVAQSLLRIEVAQSAEALQKEFFEAAQRRLNSSLERKNAGLASGVDILAAQAAYQQARVQFVQAKAESSKLKKQFEEKTKQALPADGLGFPQYPFVEASQLNSAAVSVLKQAEAIQSKNAQIQDASFFPVLGLELGYQGKFYGSAPDPQRLVALRARWDLLDGGTRLRTVAQARQSALDVRAQREELEQNLAAQLATLAQRKANVTEILAAAQQSVTIARAAKDQAEAGYRAGLVKVLDLREASEKQLQAEFGHLQAKAEEQALHLESLFLSGKLFDYVEK